MFHLFNIATSKKPVSDTPPYTSDEFTEFLYHLDEAPLATELADVGPFSAVMTNWSSGLLTTGEEGAFDAAVLSTAANRMAYSQDKSFNYLDFLYKGTIDLWWAPSAAPSTVLTASTDQNKYFFQVRPNSGSREIHFRCGKIGSGATRLVLNVNNTNLGVDVADVLSYFDYDVSAPRYTHIRGEWEHNAGIRLFLNGVEVASSTYIGTGAAENLPCRTVLARNWTYSSPYEIGMVGYYDEFRLSRTLRPAYTYIRPDPPLG